MQTKCIRSAKTTPNGMRSVVKTKDEWKRIFPMPVKTKLNIDYAWKVCSVLLSPFIRLVWELLRAGLGEVTAERRIVLGRCAAAAVFCRVRCNVFGGDRCKAGVFPLVLFQEKFVLLFLC